jgi:hypothetical protein
LPLRHQNTCNSPGTLCTAIGKGGNPVHLDPLPSVDGIAAIAKNELEENTISISQTEINCLLILSLEGDIPRNVSDT